MKNLTKWLEEARGQFLEDLQALVNVDCGTYTKAGVDYVGEWVYRRGAEWGWQMQRFPQYEFGDCWLARLTGKGAGRVILLGHLDTVYPEGTAAARPLRREGDKLIGPGVGDMKAGVLAGMYALRGLQQAGYEDYGELAMFFNSEEEIGSPNSREIYSPYLHQMDAALVLEGARANGNIVSARKGVGQYTLRVHGHSAHAGVEPEKGANAILELAHQIIAMHALNGIAPGVTVNAGVIGGGTRPNVVPDEAWAQFDVRAVDPAGAEAAHRAIMAQKERITVPRTSVDIEGHFEYPPMAKTPAVALMAELAQEAARELGFEVMDQATGGASDANNIAALGIPVLDGLGPIGGLDHSPEEFVMADSIVPRTALLAGLIQKVIAQHPQIHALRKEI